MAILSTHTGAKRSEYNKMKSVLDIAIPSDRIVTIPNLTIVYNSSGVFTVENSDIREDRFIGVYYENAEVASNCGLRVNVYDGHIEFIFDLEPTEDIVCTIMITKRGGE